MTIVSSQNGRGTLFSCTLLRLAQTNNTHSQRYIISSPAGLWQHCLSIAGDQPATHLRFHTQNLSHTSVAPGATMKASAIVHTTTRHVHPETTHLRHRLTKWLRLQDGVPPQPLGWRILSCEWLQFTCDGRAAPRGHGTGRCNGRPPTATPAGFPIMYAPQSRAAAAAPAAAARGCGAGCRCSH